PAVLPSFPTRRSSDLTRSTPPQDCPAFWKPAHRAPLVARSRSASSNTSIGSLPPSSSDSGVRVLAACSISCLPTSTEPVKKILRSEEHTSELQSRENL